MNKKDLNERVIEAAEDALADHGYVSLIDVLMGSGRLLEQHVQRWRQGRIDYLEQMIQGNPEKISAAVQNFYRWVDAQGLKPSEVAYVRHGRNGTVDLRFTAEGDPGVEKAFRTHYVSPTLSQAKQEKIKEKLEAPGKLTVFEILRDAKCSECGVEIEKHDLLYMEAGQALCLACGKLENLEFLGAGDTAMTRRATKYSSRVAVVVRFSRSRGRYERQGILAEPAAIERAEKECTEDADARAEARKKAAVVRVRDDERFAVEMTVRILDLFPRCPPGEAHAIALHTAQRGSGRVGRSAAGRRFDDQALTLAVVAAVRHNHTDYDELLASGAEREDARRRVRERVDDIVDSWR